MPELPATMPAAVYRRAGVVEVVDHPLPDIGEHDVLVEVSHCGVCGSDLHLVLDGWGQPDSIGGHEYTGRVVAVGDGVNEWSLGDQVVAGPSSRCGECRPCRSGRPSLCLARDAVGADDFQGAFARYARVPAEELLAVPAGLPMRTAALAEPLAVALHGITLGDVEPGDRVIVFGAGPIGALSTAALVAQGHDQVTVVEPSESRQDLARELGATTVVHPDELAAPGWHPGHLVDEPFDAALECSGRAAAMEAALGQLGRAGRLVLVGAGMERPSFDPNRILLNELVITGAFTYDADGFPRALELLSSGRLPVDRLIEPTDVPLSGLLDAMNDLAAGRTAGKVMITPSEGT